MGTSGLLTSAESPAIINKQLGKFLRKLSIIKGGTHKKNSCVILNNFLLSLNHATAHILSGALDNVSKDT